MKLLKSIAAALVLIVFFALIVFAQNPVQLNWREFETEHFIVYYPEGQEFTAYQSIEIAEKVREPLIKLYGEPDTKVHIIIKDTEDYANGGAYFYDNKIEISATSLDYDFRSYTDWLWGVITHELTHIYSIKNSMKAPRWLPMVYFQQIEYQDEKREDVLVGYPNVLVSYPVPMFNPPGWLSEGIAQYQARGARFDTWDSHRDMILRQSSLNDNLLTIDEMGVFNWNGLGNEMVYNHGYSIIRFISGKYGENKILELMKAMSASTAVTFDVACKRVLGISQEELHELWENSLLEKYRAVKDSLGTLVEGEIFRKSGFINGFPSWSPDGSRFAYVSNRGQDYSIAACYIANLDNGGWQWKGKEKQVKRLEKELDKKRISMLDDTELEDALLSSKGTFDIAIAPGIQSSIIWLDEWNILYNRRMPSDRYGSHWWDMYRYVINTKDPREGTPTRITHSLRGTYPDLSPDKSKLVFVKNGAGLNNLFIMNRDDNSQKQITHYDDGTRLYRPRWSPDGKKIAFTIHQGSEVNIAMINGDGSGFEYIVSSDGQDRDPAWSSDGSSLFFSSDVTGIANIYRMNMLDRSVVRITNVIGGAFSPAPSPADTTLAFSHFGNDGYEIRLLSLSTTTQPVEKGIFHNTVEYKPNTKYRNFNTAESNPHDMKTLDFSFMPTVRNDRGNIKLGSVVLKSEVTDNSNFFFGGSISPTNRDSDLYALFEYRKFIPTVFIEMIRLTRSVGKNEDFMEEFGTVIRKRTFDLNEVDFGLRYTYHDRHNFEGRLIYSRYNAQIDYTHFLTGSDVLKPYYTYSQGFDIAAIYSQDRFIRARDEAINPRGGRKILARYDRMVNFFLDDFEYVGFLKEKYKKYPYNQYFFNWEERIAVPRTKKHTFALRTQIGLTDRNMDDFYNLQLGGPRQMRGYTYYSLSGRKNVMGSVLYRFPILYDIRKPFFVWYFNHLYMGVFADIGRAWDKKSLNWSTKGFKRDAGIELRLDAISFYNFPTMIEFSAAYGPDDTWVNQYDSSDSKIYLKKYDQEPWKFYFNILFGFN
ncbi:peptidase MA family metallohydrolase [Candidatus Latescibacterota bacterium]